MSTIDPNPPLETSPAASFTAGQTLAGCYALTRRLTTGEGWEVWLANDDVLGKDVTLHFLPEAIVKDSRALPDLRAEIKRSRQLIHPQILRVFDLIEEPEWTAISMNAFEGESLALRREGQPEKRFTSAEIEPWIYKMVQTVEDAHKVHFLHRDLAPENIFLTASGQPLVGNFGLSRTIQDALAQAGQGDSARLAYASPQTLEGDGPARTDDVYSLGAVLYTLLVGAPLFSGGDVAAQVRAGVTPQLLSALERPDLQIPPAWQGAIAASLRKSPQDRPSSVAEFLKILKGEASAPVPAAGAPAAPAAPAPEAPTPPAAEKVPAVVPLPVEIPAPEPAPPPRMEPASRPASEAEDKLAELEDLVAKMDRETTAHSPAAPADAPKIESYLGPEPEVEIVESKALEQLAKTKKTPTEEPRPEPAPTVAPASRPEAKKPPAETGGARSSEAPAPAAAEPKKPLERTPLTDFKPRLYPEESRFPVGLIAAAAVILVALIIYFLSTSGKKEKTEEAGGPTPIPPPTAESTPVPEQAGNHHPTPAPTPPVLVTHTPAPKPTPSPAEIAAQENLQKAVAEKQAALDQAKQAAADAEKAHADRVKDQQSVVAAVAETQKSVDEKSQANQVTKAAVDEIAAQYKKLEDSQRTADAAAVEAQRLAMEKARVAAEAKKAIQDLEKERGDKLALQDKGTGELEALQKTLAEKQRLAADAAKAVADAETAQQQQLAAVTKSDQELARAKSALDMQASLTSKLQNMKTVENTPVNPATTPAPVSGPATPLPVPAPSTPRLVSIPSTPLPTPAPSTPPAAQKPAGPTPIVIARLTTPAPTTSTPPVTVPTTGSNGANSLGEQFASVGDVDFCTWLVRLKDFAEFAKQVNLRSSAWSSPGFQQEPDHPVVNVTWVEAMAFCKWLTDKEHKDGTLPANQYYRLPTDLEWSKAVGLPEETGKTPADRDMDVPDVYPWGTEWPPPKGAGNYTGEETGSDVAIKGYDDGYAWTSPVGRFNPNKYGLYDMGGNVWEWCMDNWSNESKAKVLRGASWYNGALKLSLLSSCRVHAAPDSSTDNYGFRIVRATESPAAARNRFR